jgi:hypothetical protein
VTYLWSNNATTEDLTGVPAGTYTVNLSDAGGCPGTATATVSEPPALVAGDITATPEFTVGTCSSYTIYLGYGPQTINLSVSPSGGTPGYTYSWAPAASATTPTASSTDVSPTVSTTYTVTVTDANGCTATSSFLIHVVDVRCGNNNDKVVVCHNGNVPICISPSAVPAHISGHGDCLGNCASASAKGLAPNQSYLNNGAIAVFPNPAHNLINVALKDIGQTYQAYQIVDISGRIVKTHNLNGDIRQDLLTIDVSAYTPGIYFIRAIMESGTTETRFVIQ